VIFLLLLIGLPVLEILAFVEVAHLIGWLAALALLIATSLLGTRVLRAQSRAAIERVSGAISQRREPARTAIDGLLGFLGAVLLAIPGFVTDVLGALLLLPLTRRFAGRRLSRHYAGRVMRFATSTARFASSGSARRRPADVDSTAFEDDLDQLGR
jgi:UPF0716 protein FxsA